MAAIAPKRFTPQEILIGQPDEWIVPQLPYEADTDLTEPNEQIRRVIVSLHGNGGDALTYYDNGKTVVETRNALSPGVANETFVIAPQFFKPSEVNTPFADDLLYWSGARAEGGLSGIDTAAPRQFRIRSYDVMDTLLTELCRPDLFPNLKIIVLAGQSNGGRFLARYAAASPFEDRIARQRGVHVRYVVMGAGAFLYMNDKRLRFTDESYKDAAHNDDWRDSIVDLTDFASVCSVDAEYYNRWPNGLENLWTYPNRLGADKIREQFGQRDVVYLVGEEDLSESFEKCPERVQGPVTLAKTLLYFRHLEQIYGDELQHRLRVVAGVAHNGRETMNSPAGIEEIFRPRPFAETEEIMIDYSDLSTVYGRISRLQVEQVGSRAQLRCNLKTEGNAPARAFFAYLDGDDSGVVGRQLDLMRDAFTHRLRVRVLYNPEDGDNWKRFYDVRVYQDD